MIRTVEILDYFGFKYKLLLVETLVESPNWISRNYNTPLTLQSGKLHVFSNRD